VRKEEETMSLTSRGSTAVFFLACLSVVPAAFGQTTWYVDAANCPGSGTSVDPFCKIQDAINAAAGNATPPDEIVVADGIYTGTGNKNLDFGGKIIVLRSENGPAHCIIDCEGSGRGFYFHSGETAAACVEGLTIRNGNADSSIPEGGGGGGIYCRFAGPTIVNCTISRNKADVGGGGVCCFSWDSPAAVLTNCSIIDNRAAERGGGVYCVGGPDGGPSITNCTISGNIVYAVLSAYYGCGGGGVYLDGGTLTNCTISNNRASTDGGGIALGEGAIVQCVINNNAAFYCGGGINSGMMAISTLTNCTITENIAPIGSGMCVWDDEYQATSLSNCILFGNTGGNDLGGWMELGPEVSYCDVEGGAIWWWPSWGPTDIDADPHFALADDFHLMPDSPCIDTGTDTPIGGLPAEDFDGTTRPLDGDGDGQTRADVGAWEFNPAVPTIAVSPPSITLLVVPRQTGPTSKTLSIRNAGGGTLNWELNWDAPWLHASQTQGQATGEVATVTLTVDPADITSETPSAMLAVSAFGASNTPRFIEVVPHVARTLRVPSEYPTIQAAIDAAIPGDEVVLADGIYTGIGNTNLSFFGKAITLRSSSGNPAACIIDCQHAARGFLFYCGEGPDSVVENVTIRNGSTAYDIRDQMGGAVYCSSSNPTLVRCVIVGASEGGGVGCWNASPMLTRCVIARNTGGYDGGGVGCIAYSNPVLTDCVIAGNSEAGVGGWSSNPILSNCTIVGNDSGVDCDSCSPALDNCILWGNTSGQICGTHATPTLRYCDVQGGWSGSGTGNINSNPLFVDPDGPDNDPNTWQDNDYRLATGSPCIDSGDPAFVPPPGRMDLDGRYRVWDGSHDGVARVDMGACEFDSLRFADPNCDRFTNGLDIDALVLALLDPDGYATAYPRCSITRADMNGDGFVNVADIEMFVVALTGG
jgi:hypothetical protein